MVDDVEHRRLAIASDLAAYHWHDISDYSLPGQVSVHLVPLDQYRTSRRLGTAGNVLGKFLNLYPLVVDHPGDVDHEIEPRRVFL